VYPPYENTHIFIILQIYYFVNLSS